MSRPRIKRISAVTAATIFFKMQFPEKIKRYGKNYVNDTYFKEWVDRFRSGSPERYCDSDSLKKVTKIRKKGYVW